MIYAENPTQAIMPCPTFRMKSFESEMGHML